MKTRLLSSVLVAVALAASVLLAIEIKPGVERWSIKTSVPANADLKHPKLVSFADLIALPDPVTHPKKDDKLYAKTRYPAFPNTLGVKEGDILAVRGWIHLIAGESDGDFHVQMSASETDGNNCLIVEVPEDDPEFVSSPSLRKVLTPVRDFLVKNALHGKSGSESGTIIKPAIYVEVTGQLFYDDAHVGDPPRGKKGMKAATLWELHPVTNIVTAKP